MAANNTYIGYHINKTSSTTPSKTFKTTIDAIKYAHKTHNINVMQIWSHVSRSGIPMKLEFDEIKEYINTNNIELYTHGSYPTISIYKGEKIERITSELDSAKKLGAKGVVIHINKHSPEKIIDTLKKHRTVWEKFNIPILIENSAYTTKSDKEYGYDTVDKINKLYDMIRKEFPKTYATGCIDTAHLSSAGVEPSTWTKIKLTNIKLIHLNGSEKAFGCGVDKHAIPFYKAPDKSVNVSDKIPKDDLVKFVQYCKSKNKPMVIEANRGETSALIDSINIIRDS